LAVEELQKAQRLLQYSLEQSGRLILRLDRIIADDDVIDKSRQTLTRYNQYAAKSAESA